MKCMRCGYQSPAPFNRCPACGAVQVVQQPVAVSPYKVKTKTRSGGETAAIVAAIVVSVISVIASIFIFLSFMSYVGSKIIASDEFGIDSFDDSDSDDYSGNFADFFKEFNKRNRDNNDSNATVGMNTPIQFKEKLYSFSEGDVETEYEVSMIETYRGEAALKLLEGATLPRYDEDKYDIYLVKFSISITNQEADAIVTAPMSNPVAYSSDADSLFTSDYSAIYNLDYANKYALISKGDTVDSWMGFIVDKDEQSPRILWNVYEDKAFRNSDPAISDPDAVEAGAAIEIIEDVSSDESAESSSSDDATSSD